MDNADVARIFDEVADLLEIQDENPFRVRAYRNAARTVRALGEPLASLAEKDAGALTALPGIGTRYGTFMAASGGSAAGRRRPAAAAPAAAPIESVRWLPADGAPPTAAPRPSARDAR